LAILDQAEFVVMTERPVAAEQQRGVVAPAASRCPYQPSLRHHQRQERAVYRQGGRSGSVGGTWTSRWLRHLAGKFPTLSPEVYLRSGPLIAVIVATAVSVAGCGGSPISSLSGKSESAATVTAATPSTEVLPQPDSNTPLIVGKSYRFGVWTHCGVDLIGLDGSYWQADPKLGDGNPPPGWDAPIQRGVIRLVTKTLATFEGPSGQRATFKRLAGDPGYACA
jgi:hypothetical protein